MGLATLGNTAAGLIFNESCGCGGTIDGFSWSPPFREGLVLCQQGRPRVFVYLSGGQLRPTDRAMAARSARTSSSEAESRSTDEEDRLLTEAVHGERLKKLMIQTVTSPFFLETNLSHGPHRSCSKVISASQ